MAKAYLVLSSVLKCANSPRETSMVCGWGTLPFSTATAKSLYQRCNASAMRSSKGPRAVRLPVMLTTGVVDGLSDMSAIPPYAHIIVPRCLIKEDEGVSYFHPLPDV